MNRPNFTLEQEEWLCDTLGDWYCTWKSKITDNQQPHYLGIATEQLKMVLCGLPLNTLVEDIVRGKT
jgi:hypothetical protein